MPVPPVAAILDRELRTLAREIEAYPDERDLWRRPPGVANSAGTLALHLAGNLQHYVGTLLGGTGYVRDRPAEFALRDVPREKILAEIEAARSAVRAGASRLNDALAGAEFPETVGGVRVTTAEYLIHLVSHFAYHLGQIDYHRRVVTEQSGGVDAVRALELGSAKPAPD